MLRQSNCNRNYSNNTNRYYDTNHHDHYEYHNIEKKQHIPRDGALVATAEVEAIGVVVASGRGNRRSSGCRSSITMVAATAAYGKHSPMRSASNR